MNSFDTTTGLVSLLLMMGFFLGMFLLLRAIMLWYWRVNEIITNQLHQISLLTINNDLLAKLVKGEKPKEIPPSTDSKEEIQRKAKLYDEANQKSKT